MRANLFSLGLIKHYSMVGESELVHWFVIVGEELRVYTAIVIMLCCYLICLSHSRVAVYEPGGILEEKQSTRGNK